MCRAFGVHFFWPTLYVLQPWLIDRLQLTTYNLILFDDRS